MPVDASVADHPSIGWVGRLVPVLGSHFAVTKEYEVTSDPTQTSALGAV